MDNRYSETDTSAQGAPADLLRCVYLERLQRLVDLRAAPDAFERSDTKQLVNFATYSTYRDCVGLGMRAIARRILGLPAD